MFAYWLLDAARPTTVKFSNLKVYLFATEQKQDKIRQTEDRHLKSTLLSNSPELALRFNFLASFHSFHFPHISHLYYSPFSSSSQSNSLPSNFPSILFPFPLTTFPPFLLLSSPTLPFPFPTTSQFYPRFCPALPLPYPFTSFHFHPHSCRSSSTPL